MMKPKLVLFAGIALMGLSSPTFAQSFDSDFSAGRELPVNYGVNADENGIQPQSQPLFDSIQRHGHVPYKRRDHALYDWRPFTPTATDPNSAAATGGGSLGYNQMLLID